MDSMNSLVREGRIAWEPASKAWLAQPNDIVDALSREGFAEFKAAETRSARDRMPTGGIWQGLDTRTGAVASAIWVRGDDTDARAVVYVEVDGHAIDG